MFKSTTSVGKSEDGVGVARHYFGETTGHYKPGIEEPFDQEDQGSPVVQIVAPPVTRRLIMGAEDDEGMSSERMILAAAAHGNLRALEDLIKDAANLNIKDELGRTPIHLAASIGKNVFF